MSSTIIIDLEKIPQETRDWLKSRRVIWHKSPHVCHVPCRIDGRIEFMPYGYDYLVTTPLEVLKEKSERHVQMQNDAKKATYKYILKKL